LDKQKILERRRNILKNSVNLWYKLYKFFYWKWDGIIKRSQRKRIEWQKRRNEKIMRKLVAENKQRKRRIHGTTQSSTTSELKRVNTKTNEYLAIAPKHLSIIDNCEDTLLFFNDIIDDIQHKKSFRAYYFDISSVEKITNDAIMYILAIVYNIKKNIIYRFSFKGNVPKDNKARKLFEESGFLNYVKTKSEKISAPSDKLQIITGKGTKGDEASKIVDFAACSLNINSDDKRLKALYRVLIELMGNTGYHAYKEYEGIMTKRWYVFAEKTKDRMKFVFLDTGLGIPFTIRKKGFLEKFGIKSDEDLLLAAFTEPYRSRTNQSNRGLGLPATYRICKDSLIGNFIAISGMGKCKISAESNITSHLYRKLHGTLFYWEILKRKA
jgi:hypothetical protein